MVADCATAPFLEWTESALCAGVSPGWWGSSEHFSLYCDPGGSARPGSGLPCSKKSRDRLCAPVGPPTTGGLPVPPPPPPRTEGIAVKREAPASAPSAPAEVAEAPSSSARGAREEAERSRSLQKPKKEKKKEKAEGKRSKARDSKTERGESPGRKERKERPRSKNRSGEESARGSREAFIDKRPVSRARSPRLEDRDRGRGRPREPEHPPRRWEGPILTVRRPIGEAEPRADPQRKRALNKGRKKRERQRAWREDRAQG